MVPGQSEVFAESPLRMPKIELLGLFPVGRRLVRPSIDALFIGR
jgi:hypothetical protein